MELYTLDGLLRRTEVIDRFESLIWTERFTDIGDFQLLIESTKETRQLLSAGTRLALNDSHRVMKCELTDDKYDNEGRRMLEVTGRSIEQVLDDRLTKVAVYGGGVAVPGKWVLDGLPADLMRYIVAQVCMSGGLDQIPNMTTGNIFPYDTIPEPDQSVHQEIEVKSLFVALKEMADAYDIGFRIARDPFTGQLYFNVYPGSDRTTGQSDYPPVLFSPELDSLQNAREVKSIAAAKTVAYVYSEDFTTPRIVYAPGTDPALAGFDRRVLHVEANDIKADMPNFEAIFEQRGKEELAKNRTFAGFDGELNQRAEFSYGRDYNLGDIVETRSSDGATSLMRVTEQIFVSDAEGDRSYPTLTISQFIEPGSWIAPKYNVPWASMDETEFWANQP